jgi:hypothetical protein
LTFFLSIAKNRSWLLNCLNQNFVAWKATERFRWRKYATGDNLAVERSSRCTGESILNQGTAAIIPHLRHATLAFLANQNLARRSDNFLDGP